MTIQEFKSAVFTAFGNSLEFATPGRVREFIDNIYRQLLSGNYKTKIVDLQEELLTYEQIVKDFFVKVFAYPQDVAFILLWLIAFELSFGILETGYYEEKLSDIFPKYD